MVMSTMGQIRGAEARGRFFPISLKLAGTTVAVVAVVAACIYFALVRYERANLARSKEAAASMVVRLYVATAVAPLTFGDEKGVQDVVALLSANDDIVYASAWSLSEDGRRLGARLGELKRGEAVLPQSSVPTEMRLWRTSDALVADAPVLDPTGKRVGVVLAAFSLAPELAAIASMERRILATSIGASALLTAILLLLARRVIVRPLARLVQAAHALERGAEASVEVAANDEIGTLTVAFVQMSDAIKQRETRIAERNRDMRRVLDNVEDGFLAVDAAGGMSEERSRVIEEWFGPPAPGATLFDYFGQMAGDKLGQWLRFAWDLVVDGAMPLEVSLDQLPKKFDRAGRFYSVTYRPILDGEALKAMLVVIRDVTEHVELERAEQMQREMMVIFTHVLTGRTAFDEFFADATRLVGLIERGDDLDDATLTRHIHTLKGNTAIFGIDSVARYCHELESRMLEETTRPTAAQVAALRSVWDAVARTYSKFSGERSAQIVIDEDEQRELLRVIRAGANAHEIAAIVTSWRYERAVTRMNAIGDQVRHVALRMGKGEVDLQITPTKLRLPPQRWAQFWSVFGHVVRNAVDHGIESPETRRELGKPEKGAVRMSFEEGVAGVVFRFGDDGAGIDWDRLAAKAAARGLPTSTRQELERALFADAVSTRDAASTTSGRGVGMAAVLACVTAHGGTVKVETAPGKGTTWVFTFPSMMLAGEDSLGMSTPPAAPRAAATA